MPEHVSKFSGDPTPVRWGLRLITVAYVVLLVAWPTYLVFQHAFACAVMRDQLDQAVALGGCVLGVRTHVEVQPRTVAEEDVRTAAPRYDPPEQIAGHLVRAEPAVAVESARHTEFGLDTHDSPLHVFERTGCRVTAY